MVGGIQGQVNESRGVGGILSRFDLILFSWTNPLVPVQKVVDSLGPGGIVVMECGQEFVPERNSILHLFDSLLIARYEIVRTKADWGDRREMDVFRLVDCRRENVSAGPDEIHVCAQARATTLGRSDRRRQAVQ